MGTSDQNSDSLDYFELKDSIAIVTGASSGLGRHYAKTLARAGCIVGLVARREELLQELVGEIESKGGKALALPLDVTDTENIAGTIDKITESFGIPTILINNAGIASYTRFLDAPIEETTRVFEVNQTSLWSFTQNFARKLIEVKKPGSIINISSVAGIGIAPGAGSYSVSKGAVTHMTYIHAFDLAKHNIRVNAIAPGYFCTDMNRKFLTSPAGLKMIQGIPMKRTGEESDLDGLLLLLASNRSSFMTGAVIPIDGGHLLSGL